MFYMILKYANMIAINKLGNIFDTFIVLSHIRFIPTQNINNEPISDI